MNLRKPLWCLFGKHTLQPTGWHRVSYLTLFGSELVCTSCGTRFYAHHQGGRRRELWTADWESERQHGANLWMYKSPFDPHEEAAQRVLGKHYQEARKD